MACSAAPSQDSPRLMLPSGKLLALDVIHGRVTYCRVSQDFSIYIQPSLTGKFRPAVHIDFCKTCGANGRRKGSLSGLSIMRPSNSAAAQCQCLTADPNIPIIA
ncbi:alanine dehydrogenase [Striga asiatica]|uniref:Alanine dehydrogenase n=1 Tax=Striga asiatica TaxID=4170 RepID=A0A5A7RBI2_STRAF|nr:alanine dehydrogenase [Striga asiatica]